MKEDWKSNSSGTRRKRSAISRSLAVSFETAKQVFFDPYLIVVEDCEFEGEVRYHALGHPVLELCS
jgi:uncharacterized DUF497 family protein